MHSMIASLVIQVYLANVFCNNANHIFNLSHSARVVHSASHSNVTLRGRPTSCPYESFQDVVLRPGVRRTQFVRPTRRCIVFYTSATNQSARKTFIRAQSRASTQCPWTSCRVGCHGLVAYQRLPSAQIGAARGLSSIDKSYKMVATKQTHRLEYLGEPSYDIKTSPHNGLVYID